MQYYAYITTVLVCMQVYNFFNEFWHEYVNTKTNQHGFHDWQIVNVVHTDDQTYAKHQEAGTDELGFQPLLLTMVNPLQQKSKKVIIKNVNDATADSLKNYCRDQYIDQLESRFINARADTFNAFTEYETWDEFYRVWLERDGKPVHHQNIPVLFDHTPSIEYWAKKQAGEKVLPYQRLLVTTYFVSKDKFFDFFIKNIDDNELEQIKLLIKSKLSLNSDLLFSLSGGRSE